MISRFAGPARVLVLAITVVLAAGALMVGRGVAADPPVLTVGEPSPQTFFATEPVSVPDDAARAAAQQQARLQVPTEYSNDPQVTNAVLADIRQFFADVRTAATPDPAVEPAPDVGGEPFATSTTSPATTLAEPSEDTTTTPTTVAAGTGDGAAVADEPAEPTTTSSTSTTTTTVPPRPRDEQSALLASSSPQVAPPVREAMLDLINADFAGQAGGAPPFFNEVEREALEIARQVLVQDGGIVAEDVDDVQRELITTPPPVLLPQLTFDNRAVARSAIGGVVATFLQANKRIDQDLTRELQDLAAQAVPEQQVDFVLGETIVEEGERLTDVQIQAISELGLLEPAEQLRLEALGAVAALTVLLASFFLWRVANRQWRNPKRVALFGVVVVLAAVAARVPEILPDDRPEYLFVVPAAVFGYLGAILFDSRTAALLAIPVATFTGLATGDVGVTLFAAGATMAPVPFVSSVSSRRQLRLAVLSSAAVVAPLAAAIAWFFGGGDLWWRAAAIAFANGIASGIVALGVLPFLENLFRVTTTLTLLDLTDRNHPALRRIEEEAPGTFNHSILVGTLAGKAARAINADALLAQSAAYYHDLGKTLRPRYFIENQFGVSNPHDEMSPDESAEVIRAHVADGLRLARQYGIPDEVAEGIRMHHGTGLMRYFYHRALEDEPGVDPAVFRHHGQKPQRKEMAILMLADAVEGATRALVQHEDPTSAGIRKLVEQVIAEKVEDGQLDDSALTFGELTKVKDALVEALLGYYHTRIPYPSFPGRAVEPAPAGR